MKEFRYFRIIWDKRGRQAGRWLAIYCHKSEVNFYFFFTLTPHKSNKTFAHWVIKTPLFKLTKNNNETGVYLSFGKQEFGLLLHR